MLSRVLVMSVSVYVCLSVTSRTSINTNEWIELVSGMTASFQEYYIVLKNPGMFKIKVLYSVTLSQTPDLENIALAYRLSKRVNDLARERWTLRVC